MMLEALMLSIVLLAKPAKAVRGCTVIAIQPDLRSKKAVCDSDTSLLTKLPTDLPDTLISLRVTQQNIRRIDGKELRRLVYLEELYLDSCQLEQVDLNAFEGLNRLRILSLRNNSLRLDENALFSTTFYHLPALEVLDLSENPLGRVPPNFFPNVLGKSLSELRLSHIKSDSPLHLEAFSFSVLRKLQVLDLSFCRLETLSGDFRSVFQRMEKLHELQLGGNPWHCDCNLRWLREWYLSDTLPSMKLSYEQKTKFGTISTVTPSCKLPYSVKHRLIFCPSGKGVIEPEEFICKQWIGSKQKQIAALLGSNISLSCQGYFDVKKDVQWFKDRLPLVNRPPNYIISQSTSLDFVAYLNITGVRPEDEGVWECGLDDGSGLQKASINVTVKLMSGGGVPSPMNESQRQSLVYAGIGAAVILVLLAAIALSVFYCWGKRGPEKQPGISGCANRLQKNNTYGVGMLNMGEDARELIGTRVANSHPDSPVPVKNISAADTNCKEMHNIKVNSTEPTKAPTAECSLPTSLTTQVGLSIPSPKLVALTTTTTTTTSLTQLASATTYKQPQSTVLVATEFSTPNTSTNVNTAGLYQLSISGGYGAVPLSTSIFAQVAGPSSSAAGAPANNPFFISASCPIHGVNTKLRGDSKEQSLRSSIYDACPIHGSPASVASRNAMKGTASSFTQTPRDTGKSRSASSLRTAGKRAEKYGYHKIPTSGSRGDSSRLPRGSTSPRARYHTLPSRVDAHTATSCPIHGRVMPSALKKRSNSMSFDPQSQFSLRNRRARSITLDVPYCSSCASTTSSEGVAVAGPDFEDYSSDFTESPAFECTDSGSSDYVVNSRSPFRRLSLSKSLDRTRTDTASSSQEEAAETTPVSVYSVDSTDRSGFFFNCQSRGQQPQSAFRARTILGAPLVLTAKDAAASSHPPPSRNSSDSEAPRACPNKPPNSVLVPQNNASLQQCHSRQKETPPSPTSPKLVTPKSILVKSSSYGKHWRKYSDFNDRSAEPS